MSKSAKALLAAVSVLALWGIGTIGAPGEGKPPKDKPAAEKPTTRVGTPTLPPLKPTIKEVPNLTPEQEAKLLAALKESSPKHYYEYLIALKKTRSPMYRHALGRAWMTYEKWRDAPKRVRDRVLAEREATIEIGKLVHTLRHEKDAANRAELAAKLKEAVAKKFDAEVILREYRLVQFEERIHALRVELKERMSQRDSHIEQEHKLWLERAKPLPSVPGKVPPKGPTPPKKSGKEPRPSGRG